MMEVGQRFDVFEILPYDRYKDHPVGSYRIGVLIKGYSDLVTINGKYVYTTNNLLPSIGQDVKKIGTLIITKVK
jgi:hypothetical protein